MNKDYNKDAMDFLLACNTTLKIDFKGYELPLWDTKPHATYKVTLSNNKGSYTFDFFDSAKDTEIRQAIETYQSISMLQTGDDYRKQDLFKKEGLPLYFNKENKEKFIQKYTPKEYDIIATLDVLYSDDFEGFCADFEYDTDSIQALKTYNSCIEQDRQLRKLFTHEQIEKLQENKLIIK